MTESIPTTWNDDRDAAFFGITASLIVDGFADTTALDAAVGSCDLDVAMQIEKVLEDLLAAESWETMTTRYASHSQRHCRDLVPVPAPVQSRVAR